MGRMGGVTYYQACRITKTGAFISDREKTTLMRRTVVRMVIQYRHPVDYPPEC
jgi:hypothetical protein